jgi:antitoxin component of RelBE/YafQ-DinJ toxin-antitoxin module
MITTRLQVPINNQILEKAKNKAEALGFSSINEIVRFFLKNFADGKFNIYVNSDLEYRQFLDNEVKETLRDLKSKKIKSYNHTDELMKDLNA